MGDAAGRRHRLDVEGILQSLQPVPEPDAASEQHRHLNDMHLINQPGGDELPDHGCPTADPNVLAVSSSPGLRQGLRR